MTTTATDTGTPRTRTGGKGKLSASARVVRGVIRGLYEGDYVPGQRLVEPDLMATFNVSRPTVRESIKKLETEGLVEVYPHRGATIRSLTAREALDALRVIELCVGLAARQAAQRIDEDTNRQVFEKAWQGLQDHRAASETFDGVRARNRFYSAITRISQNRELQRIVPTVHVHLIRRSYSMAPQVRFEDYVEIAEAILSGNAEAAEASVRSHIGKSAKLVEETLR